MIRPTFSHSQSASRQRGLGLRPILLVLLVASLAGCSQETPSIPQTLSVSTETMIAATASPSPVSTEPASPSVTPYPLAPVIAEVIDLGGPPSPGRNPYSFALAGERIYVANEGSYNLSVIEQGEVASVIPLGAGPYRVVGDPSADQAFVAAEASRLIYRIESGEIQDIWPQSQAPSAAALSGDTLWVGYADGSIRTLQAADGQAITVLPPRRDGMIVDLLALGGGRVAAVSFSHVHLYEPFGTEPVVSRAIPGFRSATVAGGTLYACYYDGDSGTTHIQEISGSGLEPGRTLSVPDDTLGIAIDAQRDLLYVSGTVSNAIQMLDLDSGEILASSVVGLSPQRLLLDQAARSLLATCYDGDSLAVLNAGDLATQAAIPISLRVTAMAASEDGQTLYVGLNTGEIRAVMPRGETRLVAQSGYPAAMHALPEGSLAVLDRASAQVLMYSMDGELFAAYPASRTTRMLFVDTATDTLHAGDTAISLRSDTAEVSSVIAGDASTAPVQVLMDTRRNRLYAVALNGLPGSNGGYVAYWLDGIAWREAEAIGRLGVLDVVYDEITDRFFSISSHMTEHGVQVTGADSGQMLHAIPLEVAPQAMLLNAPLHHLWVASTGALSDLAPSRTVLTGFDTRRFAPVATLSIGDPVGATAVSVASGRLYLASLDRPLVYVVQDVAQSVPEAQIVPTLLPTAGTPPVPATPEIRQTPSSTPSEDAEPSNGSTRTASPTVRPASTATITPKPTCEIPVLPGLELPEDTAGRIGCPSMPAVRENWGWQPFEGGTAFWRRDTHQVLMLLGDGRLVPFEDRWLEGMPDEACEADAPEGLWQPIRGFGLVWCNEPGMREALGWAESPEEPILATYQLFGTGLLLQSDEHGVLWLDNGCTWAWVGS
ncbi:MAG: hypothetical protein GXX94_01975 [Chloroflexi bacterium]|nr:hypothetical protein [Chloroflexota bacterium]